MFILIFALPHAYVQWLEAAAAPPAVALHFHGQPCSSSPACAHIQCLSLLQVAKFSLATLFGLCVTFLVITMMCQIRLEVLIQAERKGDASKALLDDDEVMVK